MPSTPSTALTDLSDALAEAVARVGASTVLVNAWRRFPALFLMSAGTSGSALRYGTYLQARPLSPLSVSLGLGTPPSGPPPWRGSACCADASSRGTYRLGSTRFLRLLSEAGALSETASSHSS